MTALALNLADDEPVFTDDPPTRGKPGRKRKQPRAWSESERPADFTPAWAGFRPGEHPMMPTEPPGGRR